MKENPKHIARWIKIAFEEGHQAALDETAKPWDNSTAKQIHDQLLAETKDGLTVKTSSSIGASL